MNLKNIAYFFIIVISVVSILIVGKDLIIPFVFALLIWFSVRKIRQFIDKVSFIQKHIPKWLKSLVISVFIIATLGFTTNIILNNINSVASSYEKYKTNIDKLIENTNDNFQVNIVKLIKEQSDDINYTLILSSIFESISQILSNAFMIIIYALFIFLEETYFMIKIKNIFPKKEQFEMISDIIENIDASITKYLGLKTLSSLVTGTLSFIVFLIVGIDSPFFWAFLIFVLNFIPTIGSLIGTLFPAIFCLLQFGEFLPCVLVLIFVGGIQVLIGNILEPKLMGNSMNLSALGTIISLSFWGAIWGVTGMILSVPITVILIIIFSEFPSTRSVAILFSEKGKISDK